MCIGKFYGVRIILSKWFLFLTILFGAGGLIKEVLCVFFSVIIHEMAHGFIAGKFGFPACEIELLPFGGVARIERLQDAGRGSSIMIAAAGPLCSLAVALFFFGLGLNVPSLFFDLLFRINLMLGVFNLLPAFPLDGGHILHAFLRGSMDYRRAAMPAIYLSYVVSLLLGGKVFYDFFIFHTLNFSLVILAAFIALSARKESKGLAFHAVRVMAYKKADMARRGFMETQQYTALGTTGIKEFVHRCKADRYAIVAVVDEAHHVCGVVTEVELWEALIHKGVCAKFFELFPDQR